MNKNKLMIIVGLILLLFLSSVNAVVIENINQNQETQKNQAELLAQTNLLNTQIRELKEQIDLIKTNQLTKNDLTQIYADIRQLNREANATTIISVILIIVMSFATLFIVKSKGMI